MTAATGKRMEIGLVLQGGGALGAYEYGGITALLKLMETAKANGRDIVLKVVTGVSIGAVNAACLVGAKDWKDARGRLDALWSDFMIPAPPILVTSTIALSGVPNFYAYLPGLTYVYDTHPLLMTLQQRVCFKALNASDTTLAVTAVDVKSGVLTRFVNKPLGKDTPTVIGPEHVLASGSLPPQFPWTRIGDSAKPNYYWDGGIVDNTPLGDAVEAFAHGENVRRVLVVMNLFPTVAELPLSLADVNDRVTQLRFGNRLHQDSENADRISGLVSTIDKLAKLAEGSPGGLPQELKEPVKAARNLKTVETFEITLAEDTTYSDPNGFRDFSREGIERRCKIGHDLTHDALGSVIQ